LLSGSHKNKKRSHKSLSTRHDSHLAMAKDIFDESMFIQLENMGFVNISKKYKHERIKSIVNRIVPNIDKVDSLKDKKFGFDNFKKNKKLYRQFILQMESFSSTDYSASKQIKGVIKIVCDIAKDWFDKDVFPWIAEAKKNPKKYPKVHLISREKKLKNIYNYLPVLNSTKHNHELRGRISNMLNLCLDYKPIWHSKDKFNFTIDEFLERSLRSLFATY